MRVDNGDFLREAKITGLFAIEMDKNNQTIKKTISNWPTI